MFEGTVSRVTFHSEETGYSIFHLKINDKESIKCMGTVDPISEGDYFEVDGILSHHDKYGKQLKCSTIERKMPESILAIKNYLSGHVKGVGKVLASKLVDAFEKDTINILKYEPEKAYAIKAFSKNKILAINKQLIEKDAQFEEDMFFSHIGISSNLIKKIKDEYGENYKNAILENPYSLIDKIRGIGFLKADEIAQKLNIPTNSVFRITHGVEHILKQKAMLNGHIYCPYPELIDESVRMLKVDENCINSALNTLNNNGRIIAVNDELNPSQINIYLSYYYHLEKRVAKNLLNIRDAYTICVNENNLANEIMEIEKENGVELDISQRKAVINAVGSGVFVMTGGPGTGKTTTLNILIKYIENKGLYYKLAAPTGRAAKRMSEATNRKAQTLHKLIGIPADEKEIEANVIIIDEFSMVDIELMAKLTSNIRWGTQLIMVGDIDQLPSVGAGAVLSDIIKSGQFNVSKLTKIHRQAETSNIVKNAYRINNNLPIDLKKQYQDFFHINREDASLIVSDIKSLTRDILPKQFNISPFDVQLLAPMKKGSLGIDNMNREMQFILNPKDISKNEIIYNNVIYREGDKIMNTKNNYSIEWTLNGEKGLGIYNGDIGFITRIDTENLRVEIKLEDERIITLENEELNQIVLAYAITVHKSQGSEYPVVIMPLLSGGPPILYNKNLLYTAVTRASKCMIFIGNSKIVYQMQHNEIIQTRYTSLYRFLKE